MALLILAGGRGVAPVLDCHREARPGGPRDPGPNAGGGPPAPARSGDPDAAGLPARANYLVQISIAPPRPTSDWYSGGTFPDREYTSMPATWVLSASSSIPTA